MQTTKQLNRQYLWAALALLFTLITVFSFAQKRTEKTTSKEQEPVKVKIVKIVDGDTVTIEKSMEESKVEDFTKQFDNIKGKNVQVMVTVEGNGTNSHKGRNKNTNKSASSMHFNFDMDSATAKAFSKCFMFSTSDSLPAGQTGALCKKFVWHDSLLKNMPKDFDFKFDFDHADLEKELDFDFDFDIDTKDEGKTIIMKSGNGKTIVINGDDENVSISESEEGKARTKTKTIVINDDKTKTKKKVIVTTSVVVIDMDPEEEGASNQRTPKEESSFNFYPNPSDGNFTLDLDLSGKEDALVRITDMNGKEVYNEKIAGAGKVSKSVNLNGKKGTFIVTIKQGKRTNSKKIIIE